MNQRTGARGDGKVRQMRRVIRGGVLRTGLLALLVMLAIPAVASAVGISLNRAPAPPQAIQRGAGVEQIDFAVTYETVADRVITTITDPTGIIAQQLGQSVAGQPSPASGSRQFAPAIGAPVGRYRAAVDFYSNPGPTIEASALVVFDVADSLGTLQLVKFEDVNGNGAREAGEPGVPGWVFDLVNPQGNPSVAVTQADGTITIPSVPAGVWQVAERVDPMWVAITPTSGTVTVPAGGTGTFTAGNVRPAPISGVVYIDTNRNGIRDAGEVGRAGVRLDLGGTRPGGITVTTRTVVSGSNGAYVFPDVLPGTYTVGMAVPGGLTATTPRTIGGIGITSGQGSPNNNFGLIGPGARLAGGPRPDIRINKAGPATARRGSTFTYTIAVRNRSSFTARNVEVTDLLPVSLTLVRVPSGATIRNGVITWRIGDMAPNALRVLRVPVRVSPTATGTIRNTATVTADGLPPRRDSATTRVLGPVPVARTGGVTG
jgi:uncharacterized repeat protein (TIGR01451 family)